jgi:hypothetical protein
VSAAGHALDTVDALYEALDEVSANGGELELTVLRGTEARTVTARFAPQEAAA